MTPRPVLTPRPVPDTRPVPDASPVFDAAAVLATHSAPAPRSAPATHSAPVAPRSALTWLAIGGGTLAALLAFPSPVAAATATSLKPPTTPCFRLIAFPAKPPAANDSETNHAQDTPIPPEAFFALPPDGVAHDNQPIYVLIPLPPESCPAPNPPAKTPRDTPSEPSPTKPLTKGDIATEAAIDQLGTPFSWGGGAPSGPTTGVGRGAHTKGFDCSGLTLYAWSKAGIRLGHYTGSQFRQGRRVTLGDLRKGDLLFFGGGTGDPTHVGLNLGGGMMIHAPKTGDVVRRTPFLTSTYYRPLYRGAVRPG
ncbi:NlpC/P60 family protein [Nonomuraea sp. NPDC026600]|uniref:C40 family peptidase n=1 Tax=Nonomuraea sp. NPDC026600 TaxID=3155363 RepID=UPI0033BFE70D